MSFSHCSVTIFPFYGDPEQKFCGFAALTQQQLVLPLRTKRILSKAVELLSIACVPEQSRGVYAVV